MIKLVKQRSFTAVLLVAICMLTARSVDIFHSSETVTLSAVQGNVPRVGNTLSVQRAAVLNNHIKTTESLLADIDSGKTPAPDLIVWPESGTDIDPLVPGIAADAINRLTSISRTPILVGATTLSGRTFSGGENLTAVGPRNVGILWTTESGPGEMYIKRHLVPFGEYLPLRDFLARYIKRFEQIPNDFVPGNRVGVFNVGNKKIGDVICFEIAYANHVRETIAVGAQVMVVQTNNSTFGNTTQPEQQFAITRFRAIENQRAVLVASTSGISGLIRNDGKVLSKTAQFESATVTGEVEMISDKTLATRHPYWALIVSVLILFIRYRTSRGKKS
jgi:apolipoprotein N-acyltransferase